MFTTYSASAGSGKTTHLVADYISLCFKNDSRHIDSVVESGQHSSNTFQKILAITFTNNAAAEMKKRIVETLNEFAFKPKNELKGSFAAIYGIVVNNLFPKTLPDEPLLESFMRNESLELLRSILYDYARFTLTTIDSFFQRVIRSAALYLNLNLNYSVQVDLNEFYVQAIDQLLNELSVGSKLATRLIFMLNNSMEDTGGLNVDRELKSVLEILYSDAEKNYAYLEKLKTLDTEEFKKIIVQWRQNISQIPDKLRSEIEPIARIGESHLQRLNGLSFQKPTLGKWFTKVLEDPIGNYVADIDSFRREDDGSFFRKKTLAPDEQLLADEVMPEVIQCFNQIRDIQTPLRIKYLDSIIQKKNADKLLLLFDLQEKMKSIQEQNNFFILSETNTLIYNTIKDNDIPELFDQIKFSNFFIDEFQDTSKMQWDDLKPLLANSALAQGGQVTLFGDVKQAIYRFRNGDSDLFYNLIDYERFIQRGDFSNVDEKGYCKKILKENFRSTQSVVAFNNEFFKSYSETLQQMEYYHDVEQNIHSKEPGFVQVFVQQDKKEKTLLREGLQRHPDLESYIDEDEEIKVEDAEVLRAVRDALDRNYKLGDIAILYSGNGKCTRMADILMKCGYKVVTEKSLVLNASPAVNLIIYTMKYLLHPNDLVAQTTIVYYLSKLHGQQAEIGKKLLTLAHSDFEMFVQEFAAEDNPFSIKEWLSQPLFLLVKKIIHFYRLEESQDPFIVDFENIVLDYLQNRNGELASFLLWWQQLLDTDSMFTLTLPADMDAIKLCTIHKSKGLEYPVVILPFSSTSNRVKPIWTDLVDEHVAYVNLDAKNCVGSSFEEIYQKELKNRETDMLNLLYVAHTRASEVLYVITSKAKSETSYGNCLHNFVSNTHDSISFIKDEKDDRVFYAGNRQWTNPAKPKTVLPSVEPPITTSSFNMLKITDLIDTQESVNEQALLGTFVHDFLAQQLDFPQNEEEVDALLNKVEVEKRGRLREAFHHILNDADLKPYFAPGIKTLNEITILDTDGNTYRPDRIVFADDKVMVIDYKTGQPYPKYQEQIDRYCTLLRQMGYANVDGRLLYV